MNLGSFRVAFIGQEVDDREPIGVDDGNETTVDGEWQKCREIEPRENQNYPVAKEHAEDCIGAINQVCSDADEDRSQLVVLASNLRDCSLVWRRHSNLAGRITRVLLAFCTLATDSGC